MAAVKWIVTLLAFILIGLCDNRPVTAAPVYNSEESQNSDVTDTISADVKDVAISSTHEKDTSAAEIDDDDTAENGDGEFGREEDQEVEIETESEDSNEFSDTLSHSHKSEDVRNSQNISDEENRENEKPLTDEKPKSLENSFSGEGNENIDVQELGKAGGEVDVTHGETDTSTETKTETNTFMYTDGSDVPKMKGISSSEKGTDESHERNEDDGLVGKNGEAVYSSTHLNQGSLASSEQEIDDEDKNSSEVGVAPDTEMLVGVKDNSKLPVSNFQMSSVQGDSDDASDGGTGDGSQDDNFLAVEVIGEGSPGVGSEADTEHLATSNENMEENAAELITNDDVDPTLVSPDKYQRMVGINNEHDSSQETDSSTQVLVTNHVAVQVSPEDGNGNEEGNMETNKSEEEENGNDSNASPAVDTENQNDSVDANGQVGESNMKPDSNPEGRSHKPLLPVPSSNNITSNEETSTNCNCTTKSTYVPETAVTSDEHDNVSRVVANDTRIHGENENSQSRASDEADVTKSVSVSKNNTDMFGAQVQKGDIVQQGDDGINEPGLGSQKGDSGSTGAIGSYVVLGIIMATIVILLGYSALKSRARLAQDAKSENFGTEMSDVKKSLLPGNEFKGEIQHKAHLEEDESTAKLLPDPQHTQDDVQKEECDIVIQNGVQDQKDLGRNDDPHSKEKIDLDRIEAQVEPKNSPDNSLNSQNQNSKNPFKQAVTPNKQETADGYNTHHQVLTTPSHQNPFNNVNCFPEAVVEKAPGYIIGSIGVPVAVHRVVQQPCHKL